MKVAIVNPVWDPEAPTPAETLDRFGSLTGWADAIREAGAVDVAIFQRFHASDEVDRHHVRYRFVVDGSDPKPSTWFKGVRLCRTIAAFAPDLVHVNGLDYPRLVRRLTRRLSASTSIVVQDHGGFDPATLSPWRKAWMRRGLADVDALLVATAQQATSFAYSGLVPSGVIVRDVMEASTALRATPTAHEGLALVFVGRLNANKDPMTVLDGFSRFLAHRQDATLTFVYDEATLEPQIAARLSSDAALKARVSLRGRVPNERLVEVYARADIFVLGSHFEGSGYAAIEALASGVVPVLTAIPSFRGLTDEGRIGALWRAGDAGSLRDALLRVASSDLQAQRDAARARFDARYSWSAIGQRAMEIYLELSRT